MKRINILSTETSNKIAAGEVVERPASVVKELVENSIDAEARNITIEIIDGGQKLIKIIDDGAGIHPDDIERAFLPHATSKISGADDIFNITTLGFRGEALPSIAAVSNTILRSRTEDFPSGKEISLSGGIVNHITETGLNRGTVIEVGDLFYNVPARLKFLKSSVREGALINDIVSRISLSNPDISFKLYNNDKRVLQTFGNGNLSDCVRSIYGKTMFEGVNYFEKHNDISSVYGYIGSAELSRGSRNNQTIFVNKRFIKSKLITAAVENAFKSFITVNKFPFFILFLDIFPEYVDVNIHPTKSEIKFRDDREIFKLVFDSVHAAIRSSVSSNFEVSGEDADVVVKKERYESFSYFDNPVETVPAEAGKIKIDLPIDFKGSRATEPDEGRTYENRDYSRQYSVSPVSQQHYNVSEFDKEQRNTSSIPKGTAPYEENTEAETYPKVERISKLPEFEIIGQYQKTYILAEALGDLYIIDQHAAHEKIIFERYIREIESSDIAVQMLLMPVVLELGLEDFIIYKENEDVFRNTGFVIDIFGDNTITIREVPYILGKLNVKDFILTTLDNLRDLGSGKTIEVKYNSIAKLACKSAVKANHTLSNIELKSLLKDLSYAQDPFNCPHGRPTIIKFTQYELEKKFKRVM